MKIWQVNDKSYMVSFGQFNLFQDLDTALRQAVVTAEDAGLVVMVKVGMDGPYEVVSKSNGQTVFTVEKKEVL